MSDWKEPEYDLSWADRLRVCPFCHQEVEMDMRQEEPDIGSLRCECGYTSIFSAPDDLSPLKGVIKEIRL